MSDLHELQRASPVTSQHFRDGMGRLGAGVCVVTSDGAAGRVGFTASAVSSVSDTPPTLLVCLQRSSSAHATVSANGVVCVNTLGSDGIELSRIFGGKTPSDERFAADRWSRLATGAPVLARATIAFDCRIVRTVQVHTHDVLFCEVAAMQFGDCSLGGLVYFDRKYHPLASRIDTA